MKDQDIYRVVAKLADANSHLAIVSSDKAYPTFDHPAYALIQDAKSPFGRAMYGRKNFDDNDIKLGLEKIDAAIANIEDDFVINKLQEAKEILKKEEE